MKRDEQQELTGHNIIALVNQDDNGDNEANGSGTGLGLDKMESKSQRRGQCSQGSIGLC
jgi:hypothetical protein